jgi:alpha-galactosidase/6-phospho-beta-glucosidase family protein
VSVKIAVIGGGSSMFVPGLVRRLVELPCFEGAELRLMDVDEARLATMRVLSSQLAGSSGQQLRVVASSDRRTALMGADFVIIAISVGGMTAWASDIEIPARHGVFMHIADSVGPGGIMRSLRNTPVVAAVARDVADVAPNAIILNYTNPASANAMAMAQVGTVRSLSLCSCSPLPFNADWLAGQVGVSKDLISLPLEVGGINHCTGIFSLRLTDGRDAIPLVRENTSDAITRWAIDTFGVIPYCWAHWVEFFPQLQRLEEPYAGKAQGLAMRYGRRIYDMDVQLQRIRTWEELASSWSAASGTRQLSELPHGPEDEGIVVAEVMQSVVDDRKDLFVVNVMNRSGLIANLPADAAVEVPAVVDGQGIHPLGIPDLPPGLAAMLSLHSQVQAMTMQSALTGDRGLLRQTILTDPLVAATLEPRAAEALTADLLKANAAYLPQFASSIGGTP